MSFKGYLNLCLCRQRAKDLYLLFSLRKRDYEKLQEIFCQNNEEKYHIDLFLSQRLSNFEESLNQGDLGLDLQKQVIICERVTMFWSYYLAPTLYVPTAPIIMMSSNSPLEEKVGQNSQNHSVSSEKSEIQNLFLDLTQEDLEKAGYENKKRPWSQEEDQILKNSYENQHKDWGEIAELLSGRNDKMCYSRYQRLKNQTKVQWKKTDNEKLCRLVLELGENWKQINKHFIKRNPKQIKEHYLNYLRPGIKKDDWTLSQDLKLIEYINAYGTDWKVLENNFEGRTQNQIKNRYFGRLKKLAEKKLVQRNENAEMENKIRYSE